MNNALIIINITAMIVLILSALFVLWFGIYILRLHVTTKAARAMQREKAVAAMRKASDETWAFIISEVKTHNQRRDN